MVLEPVSTLWGESRDSPSTEPYEQPQAGRLAIIRIAMGARQMESAPWTLFFPASFLAVTLFCLNFIGDGLRDALDPHYR